MAITKVKSSSIEDLDSTKLTGTIATARLSNVDLTTLSATNLTSGSIADARVPASAVTQHVPAVDLTAVRQDIAMLAMYNSVSDNRAAYNLPFSFVDHFEDSTGLTTLTNVTRNTDDEYVSSIITGTGGAYSGIYTATDPQGLKYAGSSRYAFGTGDFTVEWWQKTSDSTVQRVYGMTNEAAWTTDAWHIGYHNNNLVFGRNTAVTTQTFTIGTSSHDGAWHHLAFVRDSGTLRAYRNGVASGTTVSDSTSLGNASFRAGVGCQHGGGSESVNGLLDNFRLSNSCRYPSGTTFAVPADFTSDANTMLLLDFEDSGFAAVHGTSATSISLNQNQGSVTRGTDVIAASTANATGTLISDTQTAPTATTKMSGVILYKDNAGTATLGTDLKIYLSANNGSNWTEVPSYGAVTPLFSTGVKMVRLGEATVTSGTAPVIKAVWANQASGSKETQLHGWAMNY